MGQILVFQDWAAMDDAAEEEEGGLEHKLRRHTNVYEWPNEFDEYKTQTGERVAESLHDDGKYLEIGMKNNTRTECVHRDEGWSSELDLMVHGGQESEKHAVGNENIGADFS